MNETTARIRWEPTQYGGWTGHVGTARDFLFQVWLADAATGGWQLDSTLPGQFGSGWHHCDSDPDKLKAEAERWLEEFVSSLGAVFPAALREAVLKLTVRWKNFAASGEECADELRAAIAREIGGTPQRGGGDSGA